MRMLWRGLELPGRVKRDDEASNASYGRFTIEPFEQGFGTTIGNSLRRVLLSSLEGAAVTAVKIEGVSHEFTYIEGVMEDVTDVLLNVKGIVLRYDGDEQKTLYLKRDTAGPVTAAQIETDASVEIVNPDHHIATLTADVPLNVEFKAARGRGYATATDNRRPDQELGVLPIDSIFSPVLRVRYTTEAMRVGQRTNYDRLILEIWTDGSVYPEDALVEAALILRKHLNPFVLYHELGSDAVARAQHTRTYPQIEVDSETEELLDKPVSILNLSVRANNCLDAAKISTLRQLVSLTEGDLLRFRSFGKTSLQEVHRKLADVNLKLGMNFNDDNDFPSEGARALETESPHGVSPFDEYSSAQAPTTDGQGPEPEERTETRSPFADPQATHVSAFGERQRSE